MSGCVEGVSKVLNRYINLALWAVPVYALRIEIVYYVILKKFPVSFPVDKIRFKFVRF
jgi:hypothetical protein